MVRKYGNSKADKIAKEDAKQHAIDSLKSQLKPGQTIYITLCEVSSSGMSRTMDLFVIDKRKDQDSGKMFHYPRNITHYIADALDYPYTDRQTIRVGGCGMDMGFHVVYSLGRALYPNGFKLAKNQFGRNGDQSGFDKDGGYAFKHSWM
jgi:hypothetical protein